MIRIHSQTQLTLEGFETPFERSMDKNNRWIKLSACIPWDDLANAYYQSFNASTGRPAKDAQLQNLNPIIAIGINNIAKATEKNTTDVTTITSRKGMAINLGMFDEKRIAETGS